MDSATINFDLIQKKDAQYYSFLRAVRKQICKELAISSEEDGEHALFHPDIGFKLYGVFEHGEKNQHMKYATIIFQKIIFFKVK